MDAFDWNDLRYLLAAARRRSLSGAARRMGVAVTTVSRRLDALEAALGVRLFERTPQGLMPTDDGQRLIDHAIEVEERAMALAREALGRHSEVAGQVRISTVETIACELIVSGLEPLLETHPGLRLTVMSEHRIVSLARRECDIAVRLMRPTGNSLVGRRIGTLKFGLYASAEYLERFGQPDDPTGSLAGHRLVTYSERYAHLPEVAWLYERGGEDALSLKANSTLVVREALVSGVGMGLLPVQMAPKSLRQLVPPQSLPTRDIWLVIHEDSRRVSRIRLVADHIAKAITQALPSD